MYTFTFFGNTSTKKYCYEHQIIEALRWRFLLYSVLFFWSSCTLMFLGPCIMILTLRQLPT